MKILVDMDGVVADFVKHVCNLMDFPDPFLNPANWGDFYAFGKDSRFDWGLLEYDFWASVPLTPEADELVELLELTFGRENIAFFSSPTDNVGCMPGKVKWIEENFPQHRNRFIFGKAKHFAAHPQALLIDDKDANIQDFQAHGGGTLLFPRRWNRWYPVTPAVENPMARMREGIAYQQRHYDQSGSFAKLL